MPNVLCINPLRALAKRASARIADKTIAARYERIAIDQLLRDARNFRPMCDADLPNAPSWAREAYARGDAVDVFKANRALAARLHTIARRVDDVCKVAAAELALHPAYADKINDARAFLAKFDRVDFNTAARKAPPFALLLAAWQDDQDATPLCEPSTIQLNKGRSWTRVISVKDLRALGREFGNCLARTQRASGYGAMLAESVAQFWVLREASGNGLIVAMAAAPLATHFIEVKGQRNTPINPDHSDLLRLGRALGMRPAPPPPPPPPTAAPVRVLDVFVSWRRPCRCHRCMDWFLPSLREGLRAT